MGSNPVAVTDMAPVSWKEFLHNQATIERRFNLKRLRYMKYHTVKCIFFSRSSHHRCTIVKGVILNFAKFTGKHLCQVSFFKIKLQVSACNFIKKETLAQVFSCEFCEIFKSIFLTEVFRASPSISPLLRLAILIWI